jgi:hypothetical protein
MPVIGTVIEFGKAIDKFKAGDIRGGFLGLTKSIASLVPGLGSAVIGALEVYESKVDEEAGGDIAKKNAGFSIKMLFKDIGNAIIKGIVSMLPTSFGIRKKVANYFGIEDNSADVPPQELLDVEKEKDKKGFFSGMFSSDKDKKTPPSPVNSSDKDKKTPPSPVENNLLLAKPLGNVGVQPWASKMGDNNRQGSTVSNVPPSKKLNTKSQDSSETFIDRAKNDLPFKDSARVIQDSFNQLSDHLSGMMEEFKQAMSQMSPSPVPVSGGSGGSSGSGGVILPGTRDDKLDRHKSNYSSTNTRGLMN